MKKRFYPKRSRKVIQVQVSCVSDSDVDFYKGVLIEFYGHKLCSLTVPISLYMATCVYSYIRGNDSYRREYEFFIRYARQFGELSTSVTYSVAK